MSLVGTVGLAAAQHLERSVGPAWALASYHRLLEHGGEDRRVQAAAAQGALRCALDLDDATEISRITVAWRSLHGQSPLLTAAGEACRTLVLRGRPHSAVELAEAEIARAPAARSHYLLARCHDAAGNEEAALECYDQAAAAAAQQDDAAVICACRARRLEALLETPTPSRELLAELRDVDLSAATTSQKLIFSRVKLLSESRFVRASALSTLEELGRTADEAVARLAIALGAGHADDASADLSWVEADRIAAALRHFPEARAAEQALKRLQARQRIAAAEGAQTEPAIVAATSIVRELSDHCVRAREVIAGNVPQPDPPAADGGRDPDLALGGTALTAIVALRQQRFGEAATALEQADTLAPSGAVPPPVWTAVIMALGSQSGAVKRAAVRLAARLLTCQAHTAPPRGYLALAAALQHTDRADLLLAALREAAARREPGAREALARQLTALGWAAYHAGDCAQALGWLREAKQLWAARW